MYFNSHWAMKLVYQLFVDVVFVLVSPGNPVNHVLAVPLGEVDPVSPEAGNFNKDLASFVQDVALVTGHLRVVVDGVGNVAVPVDFFKRDFPLVVALDPVNVTIG